MPAGDWALVLQAAASMLISQIGLYFIKFESLQRWATRAKRTKQTLPISKLIWAAMIGTRIMPNSTCLGRALATSRLLARNGYKSTLHIGVRRTAGELEAHAWVEYDGRAIVDTGEALHFTRLCSWGKKRGQP